MNQKKLWDRLARENSKYYVNSDYGRGITEEEFRESGEDDYTRYILSDRFIVGKFTLKETTILEIGCGIGRIIEFMVKDFKKVIGIDISSEMIEQAKERLDYYLELTNLELLETDGETMPLPNNSIDFVFSYLVFQHMKTKEMVESNFREVYRILKPKGLFKVRIRTDKIENMDKWWAGVACDETYPIDIGFKLLKKEAVENYGLWLWLEK